MGKKHVAMQIRIPRETYEAIKEAAEEGRRSFNSQIILWAERGMPLEIRQQHNIITGVQS